MFKAARMNVQSYGLELVRMLWKYECDYVLIDVITLVNGLAYEYVLSWNEIVEVVKVRKVVGLNISNTDYSGNVTYVVKGCLLYTSDAADE